MWAVKKQVYEVSAAVGAGNPSSRCGRQKAAVGVGSPMAVVLKISACECGQLRKQVCLVSAVVGEDPHMYAPQVDVQLQHCCECWRCCSIVANAMHSKLHVSLEDCI